MIPNGPVVPIVLGPYKNVLCKHWRSGFCRNGDQCSFAHGEMELGPHPIMPPPMHPGYPPFDSKKGTLCKFFVKGKCKNGADCLFSHGEVPMLPPPRMMPLPGMMGGPPMGPPPMVGPLHSSSGYKIDLCRYRHESCPLGSLCSDAHSIDELRPGKFTEDEIRALKAAEVMHSNGLDRHYDSPSEGRNHRDARCNRPCAFWPGYCKKGDKCPYLHAAASSQHSGPHQELCKSWRAGNCLAGDACKFIHDRRASESPETQDNKSTPTANTNNDTTKSSPRPTPPWVAARAMQAARLRSRPQNSYEPNGLHKDGGMENGYWRGNSREFDGRRGYSRSRSRERIPPLGNMKAKDHSYERGENRIDSRNNRDYCIDKPSGRSNGHSSPPLINGSAHKTPNKRNTVCRYWEQGECRRGDDCHYRHENSTNGTRR